MSETINVDFKNQDSGGQHVEASTKAPIYRVHKFFSNGKIVEMLTSDAGDINYFLIMNINTPQGTLNINPQIPANTVEEAFAMVPMIEAQTMESLRAQAVRQALMTPGNAPKII